jgi:beta-lactamase regulating signal transducer with metallopeptidase domain
MPVFLLYLFKLSIGITLVYLLYRTLLQRLTFYQTNRWYLLFYPIICCIIPMIDVAPLVTAGGSPTNTIVNYIPMVQQYVAPSPSSMATATVVQNGWELINPWTIVSGIVLAGMLFFLARLLVRLASLMRIKKQAILIGNYDVKLYKVQGNLLPFSFADSIYVNTDAYSPEELQKIIRHEQVHVNQKHTMDIMLGELLCIINWYNPFAWLLRHAMRQNLEFIADNTVVNMGSDKKDYQYLLLKVTGTPVFGVVNQFNFSSLKKRITMMNSIKSTKVQLLKFSFALPLMTLLLLAFRNQTTIGANPFNSSITAFKSDTIPTEKERQDLMAGWAACNEAKAAFLTRHPNVKNMEWEDALGYGVSDIETKYKIQIGYNLHLYFIDGKERVYSTLSEPALLLFNKLYNEPMPLAPPPAPADVENDLRQVFIGTGPMRKAEFLAQVKVNKLQESYAAARDKKIKAEQKALLDEALAIRAKAEADRLEGRRLELILWARYKASKINPNSSNSTTIPSK